MNEVKTKNYFSWLHLTDLHCGMRGQNLTWNNLKHIIFNDLKTLRKKCGPWDLVLFTGDLTQKGGHEEFSNVNGEVLNKLWEYFRDLGCEPSLLAVPGNHDLVRPDITDDEVKALLKRLKDWNEVENVLTDFEENTASLYSQLFKDSFKDYNTWWNRHHLKTKNVKKGILPGDFCVTIKKEGAKIGIMGLNTAFLQLTEGSYEGKLALHSNQFHALCGGDGPKWVEDHHLCLLMTHHPPAWLEHRYRENHLKEVINSPGRFALHLCGHMHESACSEISESGSVSRFIWQGRSLCGLEYFNQDVRKIHGYSVGKIELNKNQGKLFFWPREVKSIIGGEKRIIPDNSLVLVDEHTKPKVFDLLQPYYGQNKNEFKNSDQSNDMVKSIEELQTILKGWGSKIKNKFKELDDKLKTYNVDKSIEELRNSHQAVLKSWGEIKNKFKELDDKFKKFIYRISVIIVILFFLSPIYIYLYDNKVVSPTDETLNRKLSKTKTELNQLKTEVNQVKTELNQVKTELNQAKTEVNQVKTEVNQAKTELNQAKTDLNQVKTKLHFRRPKEEYPSSIILKAEEALNKNKESTAIDILIELERVEDEDITANDLTYGARILLEKIKEISNQGAARNVAVKLVKRAKDISPNNVLATVMHYALSPYDEYPEKEASEYLKQMAEKYGKDPVLLKYIEDYFISILEKKEVNEYLKQMKDHFISKKKYNGVSGIIDIATFVIKKREADDYLEFLKKMAEKYGNEPEILKNIAHYFISILDKIEVNEYSIIKQMADHFISKKKYNGIIDIITSVSEKKEADEYLKQMAERYGKDSQLLKYIADYFFSIYNYNAITHIMTSVLNKYPGSKVASEQLEKAKKLLKNKS
ncbi:MAG: hypothetical protein GY749_38530 [Desulfobacteraceae bacterium]|nr:hypothetical protein [Desulfobacteraceae bacterium]